MTPSSHQIQIIQKQMCDVSSISSGSVNGIISSQTWQLEIRSYFWHFKKIPPSSIQLVTASYRQTAQYFVLCSRQCRLPPQHPILPFLLPNRAMNLALCSSLQPSSFKDIAYPIPTQDGTLPESQQLPQFLLQPLPLTFASDSLTPLSDLLLVWPTSLTPKTSFLMYLFLWYNFFAR